MIRAGRNLLAVLLLATLGAALAAAPAGAVTKAPAWRVYSHAAPTNLVPGQTGRNLFIVVAVNVGGAATDGSPVTITDTLPPGFTLNSDNPGNFISGITNDYQAPSATPCSPGPPVTCQLNHPVLPGERIVAMFAVDTPASGPATVTNHVTVSGGGTPPDDDTEQVAFNADPVPFGIQSLEVSLTDADGSAFTQAGGHPYSFRYGFGINTHINPNSVLPPGVVAAEDLRSLTAKLPPGLVVNPTATVRCTEVQLEVSGCPAGSAVGVVGFAINISYFPSSSGAAPLFNMVPPPGSPATFGFNPGGLNFYVHVLGNVDPSNGYALKADTPDITQYTEISRVDVNLWGDPTDTGHDRMRGDGCVGNGSNYEIKTCPVTPSDKPFLTMPSACSGPLVAGAEGVSWQNQNPGTPVTASAVYGDADGNGADIVDCDQLDFNPTLKARPTTNVADSPSGLDVDLNVPQTNSLSQRATSTLKDAVVTLPEGLVLNPSAGNGLGACTSAQIGLSSPIGQTPIRFNGAHASCPDAAKIGTVEVDTPLLDDPLPGAVYIASPHDNPFDSFLAIYIVVDDPQSGVVIKLAGHVVADPDTGQLVTTFPENPQLPFEHFKLSFFGGATGVLRTPATCGDYSTTSELSPWSGAAAAAPHDDYTIDQGPGGSCAGSEDQQPNAPSFDAGSASAVAGAFTPFVLNLSREDGTQQFAAVTVSPPPGLVGKLAGTPACSEAAIAAASSRPGKDELANPSCPASSQVGVVDVAAGAGPDPYNTQAKVYMAGPYKGAPLSFAVIAPAVAGPYDLGTVVVRTAVSIDSSTAQITATSDPLPRILEGIPLDIRSARLKLDKPNFTLNGTSCDESKISGSLLSTLGQVAPLSQRFQLAECANLGFKPSLALRLQGGHLRNGHPALTSTLTYPQGAYANLKKAQVTLPPSMQLDQSHIQAPCTRPQFAANQCPDASVIGSVTATSPLLDYDLTGPVYLRTGNNPLPDIVLALHGPASQPIEIDQVGKIDTVNARLRTTFENVPDAPLSKAVISLVGGSKGLLVNNTSLCKQVNRASVALDAQNSKFADSTPKIAIKCPKPRKRHHKRHHQRHHARHAGR